MRLTTKRCQALFLPASSVFVPHYGHHNHAPRRLYASHASSTKHHNDTPQDALHIPWPASANPTPYEIFNQSKGSSYSKAAFYRLVKLYHPDSHHSHAHSHNHTHAPSPTTTITSNTSSSIFNHKGKTIVQIAKLPKNVKIERFRMVVAANAVLCDPVKKKEYDMFGAGWGGGLQRHTSGSNRSEGPFSQGNWRTSPAGNATWEDWEEWYRIERQHYANQPGDNTNPDPPKEPLTTNTNFITFVLLFGFIGVLVQLARVDKYSATFEEKRDRQHNELTKDLYKLRREAEEMGSKGDRVRSFLRLREGAVVGEDEEGDRCFSATTKNS